MNTVNSVHKDLMVKQAKSLPGPIVVFGAGGFIGINLLLAILEHRKDVYGISQDHQHNWRFIASGVPMNNVVSCDINDFTQLKEVILNIKPKTIFNLAAYGAYSKQEEYKKIYYTNFNSSVDMLEILKDQNFSAYIHAGSSSEYGINSAAPVETSELIPNSHYAVSKTAISAALKYYGLIEKLPVVNLRLYSAYGPWEEPDRLVPVLISQARKNKFPPLVQPDISRDFIHVSDIVSAFIAAASYAGGDDVKGQSFNIGTGNKTTIRQLAYIVKDICNVNDEPAFGNMQNRNWDMPDWYANAEKAAKKLDWKYTIELTEGLKQVSEWQKEIGFDNAYWNWTNKT
ncbi:MAG TPA: NAD-dependent epimerase/dehydratase family protein [Bacteroidia bacterium]|nr:NAD-dependent epimerase/dehydratase family protein [Bacteroidia bacterium]